MSGLLKSDKQIVSAKVSMNILCEECIKDLKQNLYEGKNFAFYAKTKDWVKSISKTSSNNLITYKIDVKNPLFKNKVVHLTVHAQIVNGPYVVNRETLERNGEKREYVSVYEVRNGLIKSINIMSNK